MTKKSKTGRPSKYSAKKRRDVCAYLKTHTIKATAKKFNVPPGTVGGWARSADRDAEAVAKNASENTRRGTAKAKKATRQKPSTEELVGSMSLAALEQDATVKEVCIRLADELELYSDALDRKRRALNDAIAELRDV